MNYICMLGTQGNLSQGNDSYLFTISVPISAKQHASPYQPCILCQDVTRQVLYTDLESERHIQLSPKIQMPYRALEAFQDVHTFLDTARRFVILMQGK